MTHDWSEGLTRNRPILIPAREKVKTTLSSLMLVSIFHHPQKILKIHVGHGTPCVTNIACNLKPGSGPSSGHYPTFTTSSRFVVKNFQNKNGGSRCRVLPKIYSFAEPQLFQRT